MAWAVQFDGVSGYLPVTLNESVSSDSFALNFKFSVSPEAKDWADAISILFGDTHIVWEINGSNRALNVYRALGSDGTDQGTGAYAIDDGVHRNAVINADSGVLSIYIDGALYATSTWIGGVDISHLTVSSRYAAYESRACQTQFQFFDIYDGLSLADAQALSSGSAITPQPRLNLSANASDHSSTTLTDTIGGNDASFVGMGTEAWIDLGGSGAVTTELVDSWSVFEAVNAALLDGWSVFATVSTSLADGWQVYNAASNTLTDAWTIQGAVSSFLADEWSVFNSVSVGISDSWTIGGAASAALSDSWTVYNLTGSALTDEWRVLTTVSVTLTDEWATYTTVSTELTDQWDIGGLINAVLTDSWRIGVIVPSRNYTFSLTPRKLSGRLTDREI